MARGGSAVRVCHPYDYNWTVIGSPDCPNESLFLRSFPEDYASIIIRLSAGISRCTVLAGHVAGRRNARIAAALK
jgi:hypothetical protein